MTSVTQLFADADVRQTGTVRWTEAATELRPGVYVVSTSADPTADVGLAECPLAVESIAGLLAARPELRIDGESATVDTLARRLRQMWPQHQTIAYVGLASTSVASRVNQFYATRLGARSPHAGGWPIKMLRSDALWVHFGATDDTDAVEAAMMDRFARGLPQRIAAALIDPRSPIPFANLVVPRGRRKMHGITGAKGTTASPGEPRPATFALSTSPPSLQGQRVASQNITTADIARGNLRVPRVSKAIFPRERSHIEVEIGGTTVIASWEPGTSGDKERSGIVRLGRAVAKSHLAPGPPVGIRWASGTYRIE